MADFNDNFRKGGVLMQQALKKYAEGDYEGGDKDREEANKYYDLAMGELNADTGKMSQLYGESRNFGIIYNVFEQNVDELLENKSKHKILKEFYNLLKTNRILNEQFKVYDIFEKANNVQDVEKFVNEATDLISNSFNKNTVKKNNEKVINLFRKYKLDEYVMIPEETENLYEAIEYIMLNKKSLSNVNQFVNAQNVIKEYIVKHQSENLNESKSKSSFEDFKKELDKEEESVNESINDDEKKLIEVFTNKKTDKRSVFEGYKRETLKKIKEAMQIAEGQDKESWEKVYESINEKAYSDKMTKNIVNCAEMIEICNTIDE